MLKVKRAASGPFYIDTILLVDSNAYFLARPAAFSAVTENYLTTIVRFSSCVSAVCLALLLNCSYPALALFIADFRNAIAFSEPAGVLLVVSSFLLAFFLVAVVICASV